MFVAHSLYADVVPSNVPGEYFDTVNNNVARSITLTVTVGSTGVNIKVAAQTVAASILTRVTGVADVSVKLQDVTKTYAQIQKDKGISVPITLTATPNTSASPTGYQVVFTVLFPLINLAMNSSQFFQLQIPPASLGVTTILPCNMLYNGQSADKWVLAVPQGLNFSQTWKSDNILQQATNKASSTTFTFMIPDTAFINLQQGIYWMNSFVIMSPISTNTTLVANQIATLVKFIEQGNAMIEGQSSVYVPAAAEIAIIKANQVFLAKTLAEIAKENTPSK